MKEPFYSLSEDTIYHRFFGVLKPMPHSELQYFVNVDCEDRMGIAAVEELRSIDRSGRPKSLMTITIVPWMAYPEEEL
ncbi:MAG: hypothetical protein ACETV0_00720 [Nitrososphaeria archaeon]